MGHNSGAGGSPVAAEPSNDCGGELDRYLRSDSCDLCHNFRVNAYFDLDRHQASSSKSGLIQIQRPALETQQLA